MSHQELRRADIFSLELGDLLKLPDGRSYTIRSVIRLELNQGLCSGFLLLGEFEAVLTIPATTSAPTQLLSPQNPAILKNVQLRTIAEGVSRFWAPQIPAVAGAMSEMPFRVLAVRGQEHPVLVCFRGPESVVFGRQATLWPSNIQFSAMGVGEAVEGEAVERKTGRVQIERDVPAPERVRTPAERKKVHI
jgi:hypothetical protein